METSVDLVLDGLARHFFADDGFDAGVLCLLDLLGQVALAGLAVRVVCCRVDALLGSDGEGAPVVLLGKQLLRRFVDADHERLELPLLLNVVQEVLEHVLELAVVAQRPAPAEGVPLALLEAGGSPCLLVAPYLPAGIEEHSIRRVSVRCDCEGVISARLFDYSGCRAAY